MTNKVAIVGDGDSIMLFKAVGVDSFKVDDAKKAREILRKIANDYCVIFLTEQYALQLKDLLKIMDENPYPVVLTLPDKNGNSAFSEQVLKEAMDRALGVDILFKED